MIHNEQVLLWHTKLKTFEKTAFDLAGKANSPKHSYLLDGKKRVNVEYTEDERKAMYAQIAAGFNELRAEGDALLAELAQQDQTVDIEDDTSAIAGSLAGFITNNRMYDYSEGHKAAFKFKQIRAKYLTVYDGIRFKRAKAKLQEMTNKSGVVYTDPKRKAKRDDLRRRTQEAFDDMNRNEMLANLTAKGND